MPANSRKISSLESGLKAIADCQELLTQHEFIWIITTTPPQELFQHEGEIFVDGNLMISIGFHTLCRDGALSPVEVNTSPGQGATFI